MSDEIDLDAVLRRRDDLTSVDLDGEVVVHTPEDGAVHRLDPVATTLWRCLDGQVSLRDLAGEIAGLVEADGATVEADLLHYGSELRRKGLVR